MNEQECLQYFKDNGQHTFYGYDANEERWNLVFTDEGKFYMHELGSVTLDCNVSKWYPF